MLKKVSLLFASVLLFSACNYFGNSSPSQLQNDQPSMNKAEEMMDVAQKSIQLSLSNYKFSQDIIMVKAGEKVTIKLESLEGVHDFVIDELNVTSQKIAAGATTEISFTIPEDVSGNSYSYYCSVGNHRQMGMEGTLVVE